MGEDTRPEVSDFGSVDPAPPSENVDIMENQRVLIDEEARMFLRMRAVFGLRNIGGDDGVAALCEGLSSKSALMKHEIAYVLGQMQNPTALPSLEVLLADINEHVMVRHEAAEAMGAIGKQESRELLEKFLSDPLPEISESCEVALDLLDHRLSN